MALISMQDRTPVFETERDLTLMPLGRSGVHTGASASARLVRQAAQITRSVFADVNPGYDPADDIEAFFEQFLPRHRSVEGFGVLGSTGAGSLLWLYLIAKSLQPTQIIESGVFVGSSLFCLREAAPNAEVHAFDISFKHLAHRHDDVNYHQCDWSRIQVEAQSGNDLIFFDDHIDNAERIEQAHRRGFKNVVFDDAPDIGELNSFRYPGLPSVPMILSDAIRDGDVFEWKVGNQWLRYVHEHRRVQAAHEIIDFALRLPGFESVLGFGCGVKYFVRLKG